MNPAPELVRGSRVAVYGAGNVGREVAKLLESRGVTVDRMVDARALQLRAMDGIPVVPPGTAHEASMPLVIATFNRDADPHAIHIAMRACGAVRIIDFVELHARFSRELGDRFWLVSQDDLRSREEELREGSRSGRTTRVANATRASSRTASRPIRRCCRSPCEGFHTGPRICPYHVTLRAS